MQRCWIWYVISIQLELPVSTRMVIIALSIPEIQASDYMLCLIFDCLLYMQWLWQLDAALLIRIEVKEHISTTQLNL